MKPENPPKGKSQSKEAIEEAAKGGAGGAATQPVGEAKKKHQNKQPFLTNNIELT